MAVINGSGTIVAGKEDDTITGSSDPDSIYAGAGHDILHAGDGADSLFGESGSDLIYGEAGDDYIEDGYGDDFAYGGADRDTIISTLGGADQLFGEGDDDHLFVRRDYDVASGYGPPATQILLDGGEGSDSLQVVIQNLSAVTVVGGLGDDRVLISDLRGSLSATLGSGRDRILFEPAFAKWATRSTIIVTDFATGAEGDYLGEDAASSPGSSFIWENFLPSILLTWDGSLNPFLGGFLRLTQDGSHSLLQYDPNGGADGFPTLLKFENASASAFTADNLGGYGAGLFGTAASETLNGSGSADAVTGLAGDDVLNGLGGADFLYGDEGNDLIDGGSGSDAMSGGGGNDIYVIDSAGDKIIETATTGSTDIARTSVSYSLGTGVRVETLTTSSLTGTSALNLTGNAFANTILGNGGNNTLKGGAGIDTIKGGAGNDKVFGGTGNDILYGEGGSDSFYFDSAPSSSNRDRIEDFSSAADSVLLNKAIFNIATVGTPTATVPSAIKADAFKRIDGYSPTSPFAKAVDPDSSDRIIYDQAAGKIYFDADGSGTTKTAVLFATVDPGTVMQASDFLIFI